MLTNRMPATDANENDRLMAALAYFFTPIVPIIILLVDTMKVRPYQKYHAIQALGFFVGAWVIGEVAITIIFTICSIVTLGVGAICLWVLYFLPIIPAIYYTIIAYQGAYFDMPWLSNFMRQQGWLPPAGGATA
jgi:uncharacterized membrane protein